MIGIFGGTFNPIHFGHLNLAIELKEKHSLTEVWVVPAQISPFRQDEPLISSHHRMQMVKRAIEGIPGFKLQDFEVKREGPSFTIDTIKYIFKHYPGQYRLLLGEDSLLGFRDWKNASEIVDLIPLAIGCRRDVQLSLQLTKLGLEKKIESAIREGLTETTLMEISATMVRERLKNSLYCGHLIPSKVLDYIYENQLYFHPQS